MDLVEFLFTTCDIKAVIIVTQPSALITLVAESERAKAGEPAPMGQHRTPPRDLNAPFLSKTLRHWVYESHIIYCLYLTYS